MDHRKLGLRVYATAVDYAVALGLAGRLIERLSPLAAVRECRVYRYPKFVDCFGLWLEFGSTDQAAPFDSIRAVAAPAWEAAGGPDDASLIWSQSEHGGVAALPEATWMHLELWGGDDEGDED